MIAVAPSQVLSQAGFLMPTLSMQLNGGYSRIYTPRPDPEDIGNPFVPK